METSTIRDPNPPIVTPYQTLKIQYDIPLSWNPVSNTAPRLVGASINQFALNVIPTQVPSQRRKVYEFLNYYQEYRIKSVDFEWQPQQTHGDPAAWTQAYLANFGTPTAATADAFAYQTAFLNTSQIVIIPDKNDTYVNNTADEFYQVRSNPDARVHRVNEPFKFAYIPTVLDVMASTTQNDNSLPNAQPYRGQTINELNLNNVQINAFTSQANPWIATKVTSRPNGAATIIFNDYWVMFGYKTYVYTPDNFLNSGNLPVPIIIGHKRYSVEIEFRNPDFRPYITNPILNNLMLGTLESDQEHYKQGDKIYAFPTVEHTTPEFIKDANGNDRLITDEEMINKRTKRLNEE